MAGGSALLGRADERAAVDGVLDRARAGTSGVLIVTGEPGVGKTALLEYAIRAASGFRVARASGVESEMELAFAGLQQLCASLLAGLARLPGPQRAAVETAFGLSAGTGVPPDPLFVGLGVLGLLSEAASARPLVCVVDDVQWLDRASALALGVAVRRLDADAVAVLLAGRELGELAALPGAVQLRLAGLPDADARALLASAVPGWVTGPVIDRIVAETGGNPLALVELPRAMTPAEIAGGLGFLGTSGLPGRVEESFRRRLGPLPEATRRLVLLAAADPSGDAALLWRACSLAGIGAWAAGPARDAGLLQVEARVRFFHPLVRSAAYRAASADERLAAHGILAAATDDPDHRAWHRAQASPGPDEEIAAELERSAGRARTRGGAAAAAAFLDRSVALTLDPERRSVRAVAAAQAWYQAGGNDKALELLEIAETGPLGELPGAQAERLRAQVICTRTDGRDGVVQLLRAAQRLDQSDRELAQVTYAQALGLSMGHNPRPEVGRVLSALPLPEPPDGPGLLLHGYGVFFAQGFPHGIDVMSQALDMLLSAPVGGELGIWVLEVAAQVAMNHWDAAGADTLSSRLIGLVREMGAVGFLPIALDRRAYYCVYAGNLAGSAAAMDEAAAIRQATGSQPGRYDTGMLSALRDEESVATRHIEHLRRAPDNEASPNREVAFETSLAILYNGLGRYPEALAAAQRSSERHPAGGIGAGLTELVEAAARCDEIQAAQFALDALAVRTRLGSKDWGLGVEARSRALLAAGSTAEDLYREAIERLARTPMRLPLARAHLVYGEWLRRERRRGEARDQLRMAYDMFEAIGARSFAQRARQELTATGVTVHSRKNATLDELTPQEARIAGLAADGLSNAEIGARLYISANTVDYHLRKVFRKLSIRSRSQLHHALTPVPAPS